MTSTYLPSINAKLERLEVLLRSLNNHLEVANRLKREELDQHKEEHTNEAQ